METVKHSLETVKKLIGRKVRTKLDVDLWGTIYNRKKVGTISTISISKHGVRALVLFKWKAMKSYQQQELWIELNKLEFLVFDVELSLGILL